MEQRFESSHDDPMVCRRCGCQIYECLCVSCDECHGTGWIEEPDDEYNCPTCGGSGVVSR